MADHMTAERLRAELERIANHCEDAGLIVAPGELRNLAARLSGMQADTWRPIETAPLDRRVELWIPWPENAAGITGYPTHGKWDRDQYSRRPRPFWHYDLVHRITDMRDNPPTHWRHESEPPHV